MPICVLSLSVNLDQLLASNFTARLEQDSRRLWSDQTTLLYEEGGCKKTKPTCSVYLGASFFRPTVRDAGVLGVSSSLPLGLPINFQPPHVCLVDDWRYNGLGVDGFDRMEGLPRKQQVRDGGVAGIIKLHDVPRWKTELEQSNKQQCK